MRLRPGEWVEVKGEAEILATLDERGMLDGMPFMPEMRRFCGRRFQVKSRADRTVVEKLAVRRMKHAVHLLGGISALGYIDVQALLLRLGPGKRTAVDVSAYFWHFLDAIWIYLIALFFFWG